MRAVEHRFDAEDRRGAGRNAVDQCASANVKVAVGQPRKWVGGIVFARLAVPPDNACTDRDVVQAEADGFLQYCGLCFRRERHAFGSAAGRLGPCGQSLYTGVDSRKRGHHIGDGRPWRLDDDAEERWNPDPGIT